MMKRYREIELLGVGGMGEVWLVHDEQLGCYWAMKLLHEDAKEADRCAFETEINILTRLHHPAIPRIVDRIEEKGRIGVIMDLVEGKALSMQEEELDEATLLNYAHQILDLLAHLHEMHILYLDLKPENLILDRNGQLHLIDFGIARDKAHQQCMEHYGTIGYAPSEQYVEAVLDERCDIYAFGKTLLALYMQIKDAKALAGLTASETSLSCGLQQIINSCIEEDVNLRYPNVTIIQEELEHYSKIHDQIHIRIQKKKQAVIVLGALGMILFFLSGSCIVMGNYSLEEAYQDAMRSQDYIQAISLKPTALTPYERLYEETYEENWKQERTQASLEEANRKARLAALTRMKEVGLKETYCSDAFKARIVKDAILTREEVWQNYAFVFSETFHEDTSSTRFLKQLCMHIKQPEVVSLTMLQEELSKMVTEEKLATQERMELIVLASQLYEMERTQLSEHDYISWQTMMKQVVDQNLTQDHELSFEQRQLLVHGLKESYYYYGKFCKEANRFTDMKASFDQLFALYDTWKQQGMQDEQMAYECANAYMYLFQEGDHRQEQLSWLKQADELYQEALSIRKDFTQAEEGRKDCARLLTYWGAV